MQEKQNIEWKESWRDEYQKWICGVSKRSASNYLMELEKEYFDKKGTTGKGTYYTLKGQ